MIRGDTFILDVALVPRVKVVAGIAAAVASIALAVVGVGVLDGGVVGLCVGLVTGRAILGIAAPVAVGRVLGVRLRSQVRATIRPVLAMAVVFTAAFEGAVRFSTDSWLTLVPSVVVSVLALGLLSALLGLSRVQRRRLTRRARAMLPLPGRSAA